MRKSLLLLSCTVLFALVICVPLASADDAAPPLSDAAAVLAEPAQPVATEDTGDDALEDASSATQTRSTDPDVATARDAAALTLHSSRTLVTFGDNVVLSGALAPAAVGSDIVIEYPTGPGVWSPLVTATTDANGDFAVHIVARTNHTLRARVADDSAVSGAVHLRVMPKLVLRKVPTAPALVGARVRGRVFPATYRGSMSFSVHYKGRQRARVFTRPRNGVVDVVVPTIGLGRLPVTVRMSRSNGLFARTTRTSVKSKIRTLRPGSRGADVRALLIRMRYLNMLTPGITTRYDARAGDVTLAFHKWQRMPRTTTVDRATWARIVLATPMRARYRTKGTHIEISKSRQILSVVKRGKIVGTIHVSTGATGNTPVGHFRIYQRGGSYLYKFMAFVGNYGIHGYVPVPAFPASHGCVREPMWAAAWTWNQVSYGTPVIIYT